MLIQSGFELFVAMTGFTFLILGSLIYSGGFGIDQDGLGLQPIRKNKKSNR